MSPRDKYAGMAKHQGKSCTYDKRDIHEKSYHIGWPDNKKQRQSPKDHPNSEKCNSCTKKSSSRAIFFSGKCV